MEIEFFWVISQIVISILIIASIHYIYIFFKQNLTVPKIKDLVKKPEQQYKNIYSSLSQSKKDKEEKKDKKPPPLPVTIFNTSPLLNLVDGILVTLLSLPFD